MTDKLKNFKNIYQKLDSNTRLIIRVWLLTTLWTIILATITHNADQYSLLLLSDDLAVAARSTGVIGGICTIIAVNRDIKAK